MEKMFQALIAIDGVQSVYAYTLPHATVPLLVVHDAKMLPLIPKSTFLYPGMVILTPDDIAHGVDAFALTYVHMHTRSVFIHGKEVFPTLQYKNEHVINHMELLLRSLLIDLREMMVLHHQIHPQFVQQVLLSLDRILVGRYYSQKKAHTTNALVDLAKHIDLAWWVHIERCLHCLSGKQVQKSVQAIYDDLLALVPKIDTMH